jgi:hypothetical protein
LELLSLLSTAASRKTFETIDLYYDERSQPTGEFWSQVDEIPQVRKIPAHDRLLFYLEKFFGISDLKAKHPAIISDAFRYCHLYEMGGTWLDFDSIQLRDISALARTREFVAGRGEGPLINTGVLSFPKEHTVLRKTIELASAQLGAAEATEDYCAIGPPVFTEAVKLLGKEHIALPSIYFYPIHWRNAEAVIFSKYELPREAFSIHTWGFFNRQFFIGKSIEDFREIDSTFFSLARNLMRNLG